MKPSHPILGLLIAAICLSSFVVAEEPELKSQPSRKESPLATQIQKLFDEGYAAGAGRLKAVQQQVTGSRAVAAGDPRLDYAYGLILLKQSQPTLAKAQFDSAARSGYWPAWQMLIRSLLLEKQYDQGLSRLEQYAALVHKSKTGDSLTAAQRDAVRWIGRVIGTLQKTADAGKVGPRLTRTDAEIRKLIGEELSPDYQAGCDAIQERFEELSEQSENSRETVNQKKEQEKADQTAKVESTLSGIEKEQAATARTAEDLKKQLEDNLIKLDKQLGELERDYKFLEQQVTSIQQSYLSVGRELTSLQLQSSLQVPGKKTGTSGNSAAELRAQQLQNQMAGYEREYNAAAQRMTQISLQANGIVQQRVGIARQYEAATGTLLKKNAALDKWATRTNAKKKKLTGESYAAKNGATADARLQSFASYMPLDLETERKQLLASFTEIKSGETSP